MNMHTAFWSPAREIVPCIKGEVSQQQQEIRVMPL
jgi:hypothetical protein